MPFVITDTGLQIQTFDEILGEWDAAFRAQYGEGFKLDKGSIGAKFIAISSEREASYQQVILSLIQARDPNNATGALLDILSDITNTQRKGATKSLSENFLATGTPGTIINDGRQFQNLVNSSLWNTVQGPHTIGALGTAQIKAEANETGPYTFLTSGPSEWTIILGAVGWTQIEASADIDPEEVGRDSENNLDLRTRRRDELLTNGNDIDAIRASVLKGADACWVYENIDPITVVDGIPGGAFEVVVEGGDPATIRQAIFDNKPPGAESFGTLMGTVINSQGDPIPIGYTIPNDVDLWILITCDTTGAEGTLPPNAEQVILDAALTYAETAFKDPGFDVIPQSFFGAIFQAMTDQQGRLAITDCDVRMSLDNGSGAAPTYPVTFPPPGAGVDAYTAAARVLSLRDRSDFDSARIGVTIT